MRQLNINEIQLACGGTHYGPLLDISLMGIGAYLGSSLAYIEPLMDYTLTLGFAIYSPNPLILLSGVLLGSGIGIAISCGIQGLYYSS